MLVTKFGVELNAKLDIWMEILEEKGIQNNTVKMKYILFNFSGKGMMNE